MSDIRTGRGRCRMKRALLLCVLLGAAACGEPEGPHWNTYCAAWGRAGKASYCMRRDSSYVVPAKWVRSNTGGACVTADSTWVWPDTTQGTQ